MMEYLKENSNAISCFNDIYYLRSLIYAMYNCQNSNIEWSLDGKYFKINYRHFCEEYLNTIPVICKSVFDFITIMEFCGFRSVDGTYDEKVDELIFVRIEGQDEIVSSWEHSGRYWENPHKNCIYEKVK